MRFAMIMLALGLMMGAPVVAPTSVMNKAEAQADTASMEEQQLQAQLVALAQAGNTEGIKTLIRTKIAEGKGAMVAKVAKAVANMGAQLAGTDPNNAAALVNAAVLIANDPAVSAADSTVSNQVAMAAGVAIARMWDGSGATLNLSDGQGVVVSGNARILAAMNSIVAAVNASSNSSFRNIVYTNAPAGGKKALDANRPQNNQQQNNQQQTNNRQTVVVVPPRPTTPDTPTVPIITEPNPSQAGSPT